MKLNYLVHNSLLLNPFLNQKNPVHISTPFILQVCFNNTFLSTFTSPQALFLSAVVAKISHIFLITLIHVSCPTHFIPLDLTPLIIFYGDNKLRLLITKFIYPIYSPVTPQKQFTNTKNPYFPIRIRN